ADVASLEDVRELLLCPGGVRLSDCRCIATKFKRCDSRAGGSYQRMNISIHVRVVVPVGMRIFLQGAAFFQHVFEMPLPSVTPLICGQPLKHSLICGLL